MRHSLYLILFPVLLGAASGRPARADGPTAVTQEQRTAAALVRQLGARSFRLREQAGKQLLKMGLVAKGAVEQGIRDKDAEVRRHCLQLLPDLLRADLFARIDALVADKAGKKKHDLPGWPLFRELVGTDDEARKLFADLCRRETELLETLEKNPAQAAALCEKRCDQLGITFLHPSVSPLLPADLAALVLVGADRRVEVAPGLVESLCGAIQRPGPREALMARPPGTSFRKLVLAWMERQTETYPRASVLQAASNLNLPETRGLALKMARQKKGEAGARGAALVMLGKAGSKDQLALFESLLDDRNTVAGFGIGGPGGGWRGTTEVRDVALAMLVHLTGQKHADYGFTYTRSGQSFLFNAPFLGFSSTEDRDGALKKWKTWKSVQKK